MLEKTRQRESKAFDQVTSQGERTVDFMQDLIRRQTDLAFQREKEIRADMKQLAASEARVAALEQQLQDQAKLKQQRGNVFSHRDQAYFPAFTAQSHGRPWYPSPVLGDSYIASVPTHVPRCEMYDFAVPPSSLFDDTMYASINLNACHGVSTDKATVSVVKARASVPTFGGPQQSLECPTVQLPTAVSSSVMSARNLFPVPSQHSSPGVVAPVVSAGIGGLPFAPTPPNASVAVVQSQVIPSIPGIVGPTAAVSGQMPVPVSLVSVTVPTPSVGTSAVIAESSVVTISPPVGTTTVASATSVSYGEAANVSASIAMNSVNTVPAIAPSSSSASSLPVGTGASLSSSSSSQATYSMVVVNTPQLVRLYHNGTTSWTSFRDHFRRVAKVNRWDDNITQAQHLMLALEGNAAEVLKEISDTSPTVLQDIWDALCRRFGEVDEAREAMRKFEQRRQLDSESVVEFEQALRFLYQVAWPKAPPPPSKRRLPSKPDSKRVWLVMRCNNFHDSMP